MKNDDLPNEKEVYDTFIVEYVSNGGERGVLHPGALTAALRAVYNLGVAGGAEKLSEIFTRWINNKLDDDNFIDQFLVTQRGLCVAREPTPGERLYEVFRKKGTNVQPEWSALNASEYKLWEDLAEATADALRASMIDDDDDY